MKKIIYAIIVIAVIGLIAGAYVYPKFDSVGASPVGTEFGTQKIAAVAWSLADKSATTTSLYNADGQDRFIDSSFLACDSVGTSKTAYTGAGLAALIVRAATTSTEAPATVSNTNYIVDMSAVATSSVWSYTASTTEGVLTSLSRVWPAGTYLSFYSNATNTASCVAGVRYFAK